MSASPGARAVVLVLAAVGLTAGGYFIGRRLSPRESEPATGSASPATVEAPARGNEGAGAPAAASASADSGPGPAEPGAAPGPPLPQAAVPPATGASARTSRGRSRPVGSAPAAPAPSSLPGEAQSAPGLTLPQNAGIHVFAAGLTRIGSTRPSDASLKGFDAAAVAVKRAPRGEGSIEFEVTPSQLTTGQPYAVKIYLRNHGDKAIQVKTLTVASELNGRSSRSSLSPRSRQVAPSLVGLLAELPGVWKGDVTSWSLEAEVLTSAGDTFVNRVAWK